MTAVKRFLPTRSLASNVALITVGSVICAVSVNGLLAPKQFLSGGATGVALMIHYLTPQIGVGLLYFAINVPLIILGLVSISRRFTWYTFYGIAAFSVAVDLIHIPPLPVENLLLAAILAGLIMGLGAGLILRSAGSAGGLDILAVYANKRWNLRPGWTYTATNFLILFVAAFVVSLEAALYTLIFIFTSGKVVDAVLTGFNSRKQVIIVSQKSAELAELILNRMGRGVTFLEGRGGFTGQRKDVIMSVATLLELGRMKDLIFETDPEAFVVINDTLEVLGRRHGTRRVY